MLGESQSAGYLLEGKEILGTCLGYLLSKQSEIQHSGEWVSYDSQHINVTLFTLNKSLSAYILSLSPKVGSSYVESTQRSKVKKVLRRIVTFGTLAAVFYWTVKLFALELSPKHVLKSKISKCRIWLCVKFVPSSPVKTCQFCCLTLQYVICRLSLLLFCLLLQNNLSELLYI